MALKNFTMTAARPLPIILLADVSGSMSVEGKIQALNQAVREMNMAFAEEEAERAQIQVAIITFGAGGAHLVQELTPAAETSWQDMQAAGSTPMGAAFTLVKELVEDHEKIPSRAYRPTLILVSDGEPNDEWQAPLQALLQSERASKAIRFAMGIGADADTAMLQQFIADPEGKVFEAHEARQIQRFFRWVTMSVTSRSRSTNPNQPPPNQPDIDDYEF
ncbi:VWA domain-containing protein [Candidatus Venteria ishoeyi]|uniref:vWA domain-containing protein n=1 Tax=Candidatus Venteria ishoeyi TaxID=1899563 RepID=UPI0025A5090A|nr:VWA domain-containing protein [Candidatus Venteria ishoeyi]MDM8548222.1 VWA domain-containing protein [Candidatus Venteria ishoeyi]